MSVKGNVAYPKSQQGIENPEIFDRYVLKLLKIAGMTLHQDISVEALQNALSVPTKLSELLNDTNFIDDSEILARQEADERLGQQISQEIAYREAIDEAIAVRVALLESIAHTHQNKDVLDGITAEDIDYWNNALKTLSHDYDVAIARLYEICGELTDEFVKVYAILGITSFDGGLFTQREFNGDPLNGGSFTDPVDDYCDCGDFEPLGLMSVAIFDGGTY